MKSMPLFCSLILICSTGEIEEDLGEEVADEAEAAPREDHIEEEGKFESSAEDDLILGATPGSTGALDNDDFDEEDAKILEAGSMKGYKIVDGKKTTYFNNELDQKTKQLIGDIAPKKLEVVEAPPASSPVVGSVWNQAGTFEEKDISTYATDNIKEAVSTAEAIIHADKAIVIKVSKSEGEASIIISRGT